MNAAEHITAAVAHLELADAILGHAQPRPDKVLCPLHSAMLFALQANVAANGGEVEGFPMLVQEEPHRRE